MHSDKQKKRIRGNISLTTVILVGALLIVSGMAVLSNAMDIALSTKSYVNRQFAELRTVSCIEEGMRQLTRNASFTGTRSIAFSDGNCEVIVSNLDGEPNRKMMVITSDYNGNVVTRTKFVKTDVSPMELEN